MIQRFEHGNFAHNVIFALLAQIMAGNDLDSHRKRPIERLAVLSPQLLMTNEDLWIRCFQTFLNMMKVFCERKTQTK